MYGLCLISIMMVTLQKDIFLAKDTYNGLQ